VHRSNQLNSHLPPSNDIPSKPDPQAFIPITGSSILSKWFGESEANVKRVFDEARRNAPAVIFIDEVVSCVFFVGPLRLRACVCECRWVVGSQPAFRMDQAAGCCFLTSLIATTPTHPTPQTIPPITQSFTSTSTITTTTIHRTPS